MRCFVIGMCTVAICVSGMLTANAHAQAISMNVFPAYAPQGPISPSWTDYVDNAIGALQIESPVGGGSRDYNPAAYEWVTTPISPVDMIYTNYNSWWAMADPSSAFANLDPVFQAEYGNRIHFGLHIQTDGSTTVKLQDLRWQLDSDDVGGVGAGYFDQEGDFSTANYSTTRVGILYGPDGVRGTADDIIYNNGESGATPVNELAYVGVGDGFLSDELGSAPDNQADINATLRSLLTTCSGCWFELAGIYTLDDPSFADPLIAQAAVRIEVEPGFGGDFNHDRQVNVDDKDLLTAAIAAGTNDILYDINADGLVDFDDLEIVVHDVANTYFGDANCDGEFDSSDLIRVFQAGLYDTGSFAVWSEGDWDGDGLFDSTDLVIAFIDGGYETGPRPSVSAVPEPGTALLALCGLALVSARARRRR